MNLASTIELYAGGPGSGCNPDKGKCGHPGAGGQPLPRGRQSLRRIDSELRQAAKGNRVALMEYRPGDSDETRTYEVEPYSYRNKGKTFFGYDRTSKSIKAFELMKIVRVQQTEKRFKPRWKVELAAVSYPLQGLHMDVHPTFHPPSLKKPQHVPVDQPGETDDRFGDVAKRKSRDTERFRKRLARRSAEPIGLRPDVTTGVGLPLWSA